MVTGKLRPSDGLKTRSLSYTSSQKSSPTDSESEHESEIERKRRAKRAQKERHERAREFAAEIDDRDRRKRRDALQIRAELEEQRQDAIDKGRPPPVLSKSLQNLLNTDPDTLMGSEDSEEVNTDEADLAV